MENTKKPLIIAVEGCNASGKSYAIERLKSILNDYNLRVACLKAPDYQGLHGDVITRFLKG